MPRETFNIDNTEKNNNWVMLNLDYRDFDIIDNEIVIKYFTEDQKNEILNAINK